MGPAVTSDAGATKSRSNGLTGIISEIKLTPIRLYYIQPDDLPVDCALGADATPVYFEARRLRFLHWLSLPTKYVEELESAESDTFYLDQPDAQDVRIDDTTGSFKGTKPSINTLRNQIEQVEGMPRSLVAEEERENAVLTLEWSTRQRGHWHELLLFIAAALVGVGATCLVEGLRWWFAGRARLA
ncbi:MAG TPA: hypothetical protein VKG44_02050, partial [Candidatus Baltobacteraceae bacterium]|nr:hypothetical protein [Candidatus Baltobacteraceae bacterium]